jgi:DNA polymerase-3 subunit epsilon
MEMRISKTLVILDLETTGTWVEKDRIIEIAMVRLDPSGEKTVYHRKVNPGMPIPQVVCELTGITNDQVKDALPFKAIARDVAEFLGDADIGGFNVEKFDLPLLEREMRDAGELWSFSGRAVYDSQKIFHLNEKRDLTAAYALYCGKPLNGAHSALADTEAALEVLTAQVQRYCPGEEAIECLGRFTYREQAEFYDTERRFRWWNGELYMMFGKYARKESLREVARTDPGYLQWMLSKDFSDEVKHLVTAALKGQLPVPGEKQN